MSNVQSMTGVEETKLMHIEDAIELSKTVGVRVHWRPESTQRGVAEYAEILET